MLTEEEWLKIICGYLVPLALATILGFVGRFAGFLFFEFLNKKRIAFLLILFFVSFYVTPYGAGWLALGGFFLLVLLSLLRFLIGPKKGKNQIFFAGFYDNSGDKGFFSKNGTVRFLDASFFDIFEDLIQKSTTKELIGISAVDFRIPSLIYSWCDYDRFRRLTNRYAKHGLGVIWGTTDKDGNLQHLESRLHAELYFGKEKAQDHIDAAVTVLKNSTLKTDEKAGFLAKTLAAYWINSFTDFLTESRSYDSGLKVNKQAQLLLEKALHTLESQSASDTTKIIAFGRRMMLPNFTVEEARTRLHAEQWEEAIDRLVETLLLNPYFPYDSQKEFQTYYTAQYHADVTVWAPLKDEIIDAEMAGLEKEISPLSPPHLQLLLNWFIGCGPHLKDIDAKIESAFSILEKAFPDNPFIYLYWSDAIKVPTRLGLGKNEKMAASLNDNGLPVRVLELAVEKCEKAYSLVPMNLIASRIVGMCMPLALTYDERSLAHKKWMKKFHEYGKKASVHINDMGASWRTDEKDIYDWKKFGIEAFDEREPEN